MAKVNIFISSTCYDLSQIRDDIKQCIEDLGVNYENFIKCLLLKLAGKYKKEIVDYAINMPKEGEEDEVVDTEAKQKEDNE